MSLLKKSKILSHYKKQQKDLFLTGQFRTFKLSEDKIKQIQERAPFLLSALVKTDVFADFSLEDQILQNNFKIQVLDLNLKDVFNFTNFVKYDIGFNHYKNSKTDVELSHQIVNLDFLIFQILKDDRLTSFDKIYDEETSDPIIQLHEEDLKCFIDELDEDVDYDLSDVEDDIDDFLTSYAEELQEEYLSDIDFKIVNFFDYLVFSSEGVVETCLSTGTNTVKLPDFVIELQKEVNKNDTCSIFAIEDYFEIFMEYKKVSWNEIANYSLKQAHDLLREYYQSFKKI